MAETIHVRGEGGAVIALDLPLPESIQERLDKGLLQRVHPDGTPAAPAAPRQAAGSALTGGRVPRPAPNARKVDWVLWAIAVHGLPEETAEAMTKAALADLPDPGSPAEPAGSDLTAGRSPHPGQDAPKAEWIAHVVARGLLSADDAATYTRDDLIDLVS